ncbi:MAG: hypothetical protein KGZ89_01730 [Actinobacteria bacterium]|nr:hypothetical protein [Actinomycetota bacterium]
MDASPGGCGELIRFGPRPGCELEANELRERSGDLASYDVLDRTPSSE